MELKDLLKQIGDKFKKLKDSIETEEATKNAFIMPFMQSLWYDVFNPNEVVPEFTTDVWTKKWEKIDYAIMKDWKPTILIECKHWNQNLDIHDWQLLRYFHVSQARFGILTNWIIYRFYSDLVEPNKMDTKPFLEFDITNIKDNQFEEIKKFHKINFDIDNIVNTASELKYSHEIQNLIAKEFWNPSENFVKIFARQVYSWVMTQKVLELFNNITKKSINIYINDLINERLKSALEKQNPENSENKNNIENNIDDKIATTEEETEWFYIVKSILRKKIDHNRIWFRDSQSYFAIMIDDNNRKIICRLYLNGGKKYIWIIWPDKKEVKHEINWLDDIFTFEKEINLSLENYIKD